MQGNFWIGLVILLVGLGWQFKDQLLWAVSKIKLPTLGTSNELEADIDVLDLKALRRIQARGERLQCAEIKQACQVQYQHFFHGIGSHS